MFYSHLVENNEDHNVSANPSSALTRWKSLPVLPMNSRAIVSQARYIISIFVRVIMKE